MSAPFVIEKREDGERVYDVYSRLLEDRIIFIGNRIDSTLANSVVAQLLLLDQKDSTRDIKLYINSEGGSVTAGMAILDTMNYIKSNVMTVSIGMAASMAAVLLASGTKGKRFSLPNARVMIHEPNQTLSRDYSFTTTDQEIDTKLMLSMREQIINILSKTTDTPTNKIKRVIRRDYWMEPQQAVEFGLIDSIIEEKPEE